MRRWAQGDPACIRRPPFMRFCYLCSTGRGCVDLSDSVKMGRRSARNCRVSAPPRPKSSMACWHSCNIGGSWSSHSCGSTRSFRVVAPRSTRWRTCGPSARTEHPTCPPPLGIRGQGEDVKEEDEQGRQPEDRGTSRGNCSASRTVALSMADFGPRPSRVRSGCDVLALFDRWLASAGRVAARDNRPDSVLAEALQPRLLAASGQLARRARSSRHLGARTCRAGAATA